MEKTNRQEGENHVNDCKVKRGEREGGREGGRGREEGSRKYGGGIRNNAVDTARRSNKRERKDEGKRKEGGICISVSTWWAG